MAKLNERELKALLASERAASLSASQSSKLSEERTDAMDYYMGDVSTDIPHMTGRSSAVSSDVADTIEGLMPSLMEIFAGSEDAIRFEPVGVEDIQAADQETAYVRHVFWQMNDGYLTLYSMIKDALLSKLGIVKVWWETERDEERETYLDQTDDQYAMILASPGVEELEHSVALTDQGQQLHDVTIGYTKERQYAKVAAVPPEEFGITKRARNVADCHYCFHEVIKTQADLIEDGYEEDQVLGLASYSGLESGETTARDTVEETSITGDTDINKAMRPIRVTEHYVKMDYEQKGKARLYRVITGGEDGIVLNIKGEPAVVECDMMPFAVITPIVMPHRVFGRSVADIVMDIQRIKTVLLRGLLDNTYASNMPRPVVAQQLASDTTLDDLAVFRHGAPIRTKAPGAIEWQEVPSVINHLFPILQYMDSLREWRTGVSRQGQGLDADALNNQTATAANQLYNAAQARMKLIARTFAETGIKDLFWLLHATIRKHANQAEVIRLTNKWIPVDPRNWKSRNDITVSVGLGQGGKAERLSQFKVIMDMQNLAIQGGLQEFVTPANLYNSAKQVCRVIEEKVDLYFTDPGPEARITKGPNPEEMKGQIEMAKMQMQAKQGQVDAQMRMQEMQGKAEIEKLQAQADVATNDRKAQAEIALAQQKFQMEQDLAIMQFNLERELKMLEANLKIGIADQQMQQKDHQHQLDIEKAEMGINTEAQSAAIDQQGKAQQHKMKADEHAMKLKEQKEPPISGALKKLAEAQKAQAEKHAQMHAELMDAVGSDREIEIKRDARGKPAGAVSKRVKKNGAAKNA